MIKNRTDSINLNENCIKVSVLEFLRCRYGTIYSYRAHMRYGSCLLSHNYTFSSILMGAQVFPTPSCPMSPNIAKKTFSVTYFRYMSTSIFYQNLGFWTIFKEKVDLFKNVFLALISALNLDSSELRFAQIFLELLSIVSGHKHEVLLHVFLLVANNKILDQTSVTFSTVIDTCNLLYKKKCFKVSQDW